jgi:hypothetical protein
MLASAILLGPQRHVPIVRPAVEHLCGPKGGQLALVTAGWEERETEDAEFREHVLWPVINLRLWQRVEQIFERDPELFAAMRKRHETLRTVQELYRLRLTGLVEVARTLLRRTGDRALLDPERVGAVEMLRLLDRFHVERVQQIHEEFDARFLPAQRSEVVRHRRELQTILQDCACLCIAGGHVGLLLHRISLFDLLRLWGQRPVVAWSAGAMVLSERIVLFHDDQAQGSADAEVMEAGFGVLPGIVPLPHARQRLRLDDEINVQLFAQRFAPALCAVLDVGNRLDWDGKRWSAPAGTRCLRSTGKLVEVVS